MRTIVLAVSILGACFMQEISGGVLSATLVTQEADAKLPLSEVKADEEVDEEEDVEAEAGEQGNEEDNEADEEDVDDEAAEKWMTQGLKVVRDLAARAEELGIEAEKDGASDGTKLAAKRAHQDFSEAAAKEGLYLSSADEDNEADEDSEADEEGNEADEADEEGNEADEEDNEALEADDEESRGQGTRTANHKALDKSLGANGVGVKLVVGDEEKVLWSS